MNGTASKLRALFLATLMGLSVIAGTAAISGTVSAAANSQVGVTDPGFYSLDSDADGDEGVVTGWQSEKAATGSDAVHFVSSGPTSDYGKVVVPADFTLESGDSLSWQGYRGASSDVPARDEVYLYLDENDDGEVDAALWYHYGTGGQPTETWLTATLDLDNSEQSPSSMGQWNYLAFNSDGSISTSTTSIDITSYYGETIEYIGLAAGSPQSGPAEVDVYVDDLEYNGQQMLDESTGAVGTGYLSGILAASEDDIDDAAGGAFADSTVRVSSGTYDEQVTVAKNLTIDAESGATLTKSDTSGGFLASSYLVVRGGASVDLSGLTFQGPFDQSNTAGIVVTEDADLDASGLTMNQMYYEQGGGVSGAQYHHAILVGDKRYGGDIGTTPASGSLDLTDSTVDEFGKAAVSASGSSTDVRIENVSISGSGTINTAAQDTILIDGADVRFTDSSVSDVRYEGSFIAGTGITIYGPSGVVEIRNNDFEDVAKAISLQAFRGFDDTPGTIDGAVIKNNTVTGQFQAVDVFSEEALVNPADVVVRDTSITDNVFENGNTGLAAWVGSTENFDVDGNTFRNNSIHLWSRTESAGVFDESAIRTDNTFDTVVGVDSREKLYASIQDGINGTTDGDTVVVGDGVYHETLNISQTTGLTVESASGATPLVKPETTLTWGDETQFAGRTSSVRIVNSSDLALRGIAVDFANVSESAVSGVIVWDSTGTFEDVSLRNMSDLDGAVDLTSYVGTSNQSSRFSPNNRARFTVTDSEFVNTGRIGINTDDFTNVSVTDSTFRTNDAGYAIEIGSEGVGVIRNNTISGYDQRFSTGAHSAGIYIENAFSEREDISKRVLVADNEVSDSLFGVSVGQTFSGIGADVDTRAVLRDNRIEDNAVAGIRVTDEDAENGSSVTVVGSGNVIEGNDEYGYKVFTDGDGNVTLDVTGDRIAANSTGVYVNDTAGDSSTSTYDITVTESVLTGDTGIDNDVADVRVNATRNYWGTPTGPGNFVGPGPDVFGNVTFRPFYIDEARTVLRTRAPIPLELTADRTSITAGESVRLNLTEALTQQPVNGTIRIGGTVARTGPDGSVVVTVDTPGTVRATATKANTPQKTFLPARVAIDVAPAQDDTGGGGGGGGGGFFGPEQEPGEIPGIDAEPDTVDEAPLEDAEPGFPGTTVEFDGTSSVARVTFEDGDLSGSVRVSEFATPPQSVVDEVTAQVGGGQAGPTQVITAVDISPTDPNAEGSAATVEFEVDRDDLVDPANAVILHRTDTGWETVETAVEETTGGTVSLVGQVDSFSVFAVAETGRPEATPTAAAPTPTVGPSAGTPETGPTPAETVSVQTQTPAPEPAVETAQPTVAAEDEAGGFGPLPLVGLALLVVAVAALVVVLRRRNT